MNVLFVTGTDPRETSYGGQQRTHVLWKGLCAISGATVNVFVPVPHKWQEKSFPEERIYYICLEKRYSLGWLVQRLLKRLIPYWDCSWAYDWRRLHKIFKDVDVVVSRFIRPVAAFKLDRMAPLFIDADDIHTLEFQSQISLVGNSLIKRIQYKLLEHFQFGIYGKARLIWVPALEHVNLMKNYRFSYLPNIPCVDCSDDSDNFGNKNKLLFVGLMSSSPNFLALDDFLRGFWGRLHKDFPLLQLDIIGSGLPSFYEKEWRQYEGVNVLGFIKDIDSYWHDAMALVTPMKIGMGTCIKVLEALRRGCPVISTSKGLRGLALEDRIISNGIFEYDRYETLVEAIKYLESQADEDRKHMAQSASEFVHRNFSQTIVNDILRKDIVL